MALNDIYEVKHVQRDFDQKHIENVYFYKHVTDPVGGPYSTQAERLARDWRLDVLDPMRPTQPSSYFTDEVRVRNLFNPADTYVLPLNLAGTRASTGTDLLPSFIAAVCTLASDNGLVRKGRKMFAGLAELDQASGVLQASGLVQMAIRAACALAGVSTLVGGGKAFQPVVVKRIREGTAGNYTYRLPENQLEAVAGYVQSAVISGLVSAQDTRKK